MQHHWNIFLWSGLLNEDDVKGSNLRFGWQFKPTDSRSFHLCRENLSIQSSKRTVRLLFRTKWPTWNYSKIVNPFKFLFRSDVFFVAVVDSETPNFQDRTRPKIVCFLWNYWETQHSSAKLSKILWSKTITFYITIQYKLYSLNSKARKFGQMTKYLLIEELLLEFHSDHFPLRYHLAILKDISEDTCVFQKRWSSAVVRMYSS